ncbi:DUF397 domain-containing protein [Micromonospora sp. KLBMP9576]|uniref:DUF397 domain-containing protein n=1 Tax=Micromonospora sp. KLBMP9576 TaxID=3424769 RepID=UPI003D8F1FA1
MGLIAWRRSTRSGDSGRCAETRDRDALLDVRDREAPAVGMLSFEHAAWGAFVTGGKADGDRRR